MSIPLLPVAALTQLHLDTSRPSPTTSGLPSSARSTWQPRTCCATGCSTCCASRLPAVVEVDFAGVTFLDRVGISALVAVRNATFHAGGQMRVSYPQPTVRRVLKVTGLLGVFTAPIDQPQPLPTRSEHHSRVGPAPATQPPGMLAAA